MGRDPYYQTSDQCNLKWNLVNKLVTHWNEIYTNFEKQWARGESEPSLLKKTQATFQDDMLKLFKFIHGWDVVKRSINVNLNDDNDDIEEIHLPPPPMGRDKTKAQARGKGKGKATSSNSSVGTERSARSEKMMTQMIQLNSTLERHMAETIRLTEYSLLMQDVRHIDPQRSRGG
ncbi:unnamed protein product [Lactuca virosa]|uniref:No apical meristem-associated C-terminal domain-containing protein n=1 Tax=Lactuca virosa TaxID=75947 RepID=A0AAU9PQY5_9ASTR|nr:unnamed protein product [Lactuca virosa]